MIQHRYLFSAVGIVAVAFILLLAPGPAAHAQKLYDTDRVLDQQDNACLKHEGCATIRAKKVWVNAGEDAAVALRCPAHHPYILGWDSRHHEHITVTAVPRRTASEQASNAITFAVGNLGDAPGSATLYLGCSDVQIQSRSVMEQASAVPSIPVSEGRRP